MSFCNIYQQWSFPSWLIYIGFDFSSKMRNIFYTDSLLWWFSWHLVSSLQQISDIKPGCVLRGCNFARIEEDFSFEFTLRMAAPIFLASNSFPRLLTDLSTVSESTKRKYLPSIRWWYHADISELTLIDLRFWKELAPLYKIFATREEVQNPRHRIFMLRGTHIPFSLRRWQTKPAQISWRNSERDTLTILIIWTDIRTTKKVIIQLSLSLRSENTNEGPVPSSPSCSLAQSRAWLGMLPIFPFVL